MTEEEAKHLRQEHAKLREAYAQLKQESEQKDRRIEEVEGLLMSALLRIEELERRLAKDSAGLFLDHSALQQAPGPTLS